ncbi:hypothetical protein EON63_07815 [archaeon]|nr:MAG: hypothetical protein EON63_07815 [archaeon]
MLLYQLIHEMNALQRQSQTELQEVQRSFEQQLADLDFRLLNWRNKEAKLKKVEQKVHSAEKKWMQRVTQAKERYVALKKRHALEMEGYRSQINILKNSLKQMEKFAAHDQTHH